VSRRGHNENGCFFASPSRGNPLYYITMTNKSTTPAARVLVVEDHAIVRHGMRVLLDATPALTICGEADDVAGAWRLLTAESPDALVVDLTLQGQSGLDFIRELRAAGHRQPVLVCSMHDERTHAEKALRAGAQGYVMKEDADEVLVDALLAVLRGDRYISPRLREEWARRHIEGDDTADSDPGIAALTEREQQVFTGMGQGLTTRQIADQLGLSARTVEVHRARIKKKLDAGSAAESLRAAVRWVSQQEV